MGATRAEKGSAEAEADAALLEGARAGDRTSLERWLRRWEQPIYRFAIRMCRDPERAKDVLQESMLAAARGIDGFRGEASPSTWLFTIARSFCGKQRRRRVGEPASFVFIDEGTAGEAVPLLNDSLRSPEEAVSDRRLDAAIGDAIDALEPSQREVLVLRDVEGLSAAEVAAILGVGEEAVKSRLHRRASRFASDWHHCSIVRLAGPRRCAPIWFRSFRATSKARSMPPRAPRWSVTSSNAPDARSPASR